MKRRRRTSIRTAAGTTQAKFLERVRALRDDPLRVLPEPVGPEPRPVARARARIERLARTGKAGFLDRRDKGVVGAVANALPLAELESVSRLVDQKIAGKRRFFLQRGHVDMQCAAGVQNHDDPLALLAAWRPMAKQESLHFFAGPGLWCTGSKATPPEAWWDAYTEAAAVALQDEGDGVRGCGHQDQTRAVLRFLGGGTRIAVCTDCAPKGGVHEPLRIRYAGPRQRRPVDVGVQLPDGTELDLDLDLVGSYRAGLIAEAELIRRAVRAWRDQAGSGVFVLGDTVYADQEAFLDALDLRPWERTALAAMTRDGHTARKASATAALDDLRDHLVEGVCAIMGPSGAEFLLENAQVQPREVLRLAHEETERRRVLQALPQPKPSGPIGAWVDGAARYARTHSQREAQDHLRRDLASGAAPGHHVYAFLNALGATGMTQDIHFTDDQKRTGRAWADWAQQVLEAEGEEYLEALRRYLAETGTGETA